MIKKFNEFINEGIFDLLSGYSMEEVKEKIKRLTPLDRYDQLKKLKLKYEDIYTQEEINNLTGLDKIYFSNKYDTVDFIYVNRVRVELNNKFGIIDENGNEITPIKYDFISNFVENKAKVGLNGNYGFIDINGKEITPIKYHRVYPFIKNRSKVELNGKYGYIDENGKEITPIKYDLLLMFFKNRARYVLNGKDGYIDMDGYEI